MTTTADELNVDVKYPIRMNVKYSIFMEFSTNQKD